MGNVNGYERKRTGSARRSRSSGSYGNTGRSRSAGAYGSVTPSRDRDRARRRRRKQRQRRRLLCLLVILAAVLVCGIFMARRIFRNKARNELREQGIVSLDAGDYEAAIVLFDQALEDSGGKIGSFEVEVLELRAEAEYKQRDYEAALHTWELLLQKEPENQSYREGAVLCFLETGDYEQALTYEVLQSRVYNRMAVDQIAAGDFDQALESIALGLQAPEQSAAADLLYNQAAAWEYKGDYQQALQLYEDYVAQYGSDEKTEREITFLKSRQGDNQE